MDYLSLICTAPGIDYVLVSRCRTPSDKSAECLLEFRCISKHVLGDAGHRFDRLLNLIGILRLHIALEAVSLLQILIEHHGTDLNDLMPRNLPFVRMLLVIYGLHLKVHENAYILLFHRII